MQRSGHCLPLVEVMQNPKIIKFGEVTSKIIESSLQPSNTMFTFKPCPQMPHPQTRREEGSRKIFFHFLPTAVAGGRGLIPLQRTVHRRVYLLLVLQEGPGDSPLNIYRPSHLKFCYIASCSCAATPSGSSPEQTSPAHPILELPGFGRRLKRRPLQGLLQPQQNSEAAATFQVRRCGQKNRIKRRLTVRIKQS